VFNKYQPRRDTGFDSKLCNSALKENWENLVNPTRFRRQNSYSSLLFHDDNLLFALVFNLKFGSCELCGVIVIIVSRWLFSKEYY
jgi:hypothetical protein